MDFITAALYGVIQGFSEFLPVSSSGHLAILPHFIKMKDPGIAFDLAMHAGTALAVIIYYRKQITGIILEVPTVVLQKKYKNETYLLVNMSIATLITMIFGLIFKDLAAEYGRSAHMIAYNLIGFGLLMGLSDRNIKMNEGELTQRPAYVKAALIGLFQVMAIFPGVSRSGATLTMSRFFGISRTEATSFSFLLSLPVIAGGILLKLPELLNGEGFELSTLFFGIFISFIVGLGTIHFFLKFISRFGLWSFVCYRVLAGIVLLFILEN